jgi:integrase
VQKTIFDLKKSEEWSDRTASFYLKACRQFAAWMIEGRRAVENPLVCLKNKGKIVESKKRRALEVIEITALLSATEAAPDRFGMTGHERALLYRLAVETGLRAGELRSLTAGSFDFEENTVTVKAGYTKNRKEAVLPLREEMAEILREYLAGKLPQAAAFTMPPVHRLSKMIKTDFIEAGIDPDDQGCGKLDFHALRHTFGTMLAASGVHPKTAQDLMRHSDINLTMTRYTHTLRGQQAAAVSALPDFSKPDTAAARKTGTDDAPIELPVEVKMPEKNYAQNFDRTDRKPSDSLDKDRPTEGENPNFQDASKQAVERDKMRFSAEKQTEETGFEPALPGRVKRFSRPSPSAARPLLRC